MVKCLDIAQPIIVKLQGQWSRHTQGDCQKTKKCTCAHIKMHNLIRIDEDRIEQCFAVNIVQCCNNIVQLVTPDCQLIQAQESERYC